MKNDLKYLPAVILFLFLFPGWAQDKTPAVSDDIPKILKRTARMITELDIKPERRQYFSKQRLKIIRQVRRVIKASGSEIQKKYLGGFIKSLKDEKFDNIPESEFIIGTDYDLIIRYDRENNSMSSVALKTSIAENKSNGELFNKMRSEIGKGILGRNIRFFPEHNVIKISELIFPESMKNSRIVLSLSNGGIYPGVILLKNCINKEFEDKIKPLSERILKKKVAESITAGSLIKNTFLHHAAHYTIPFTIDADEKKKVFSGAGLKDLLADAEEIRADLNYLTLIFLMDEKELLSEGLKEEVLTTFILQKLADLKGTEGMRENGPSKTIINALYKRGGLGVDKSGAKIVIDSVMLARNIKNLETSFYDMFSKGNYSECKTFFKKHSEIPESLKKLLDNPPSKKKE